MSQRTAPDKQDMLLAFGFETARILVAADGRVDQSEVSLMHKRFPTAALVARGLIHHGELTARFGEAYNLALTKLKQLLSHEEKLALADSFFDICRADADVDGAEVQVIVSAMRTLGVSKSELAQHMRRRVGSSRG